MLPAQKGGFDTCVRNLLTRRVTEEAWDNCAGPTASHTTMSVSFEHHSESDSFVTLLLDHSSENAWSNCEYNVI